MNSIMFLPIVTASCIGIIHVSGLLCPVGKLPVGSGACRREGA